MPQIPKDHFPPDIPAETIIRDLAAKHQIKYVRTRLDDWCNDVTRLAGDEVELDGVELELVALGRAKIITPIEQTMLHGRYLRERKSIEAP